MKRTILKRLAMSCAGANRAEATAEKAAGELVLKKELLDQAAQPGHAAACVIKKRGPLLRL